MIGKNPAVLAWKATSGTTPLATDASTAVKDASVEPVRHFVTDIQVWNIHATVSTAISLLDDTTVIWTGYLPAITATLPIVPVNVQFSAPLEVTPGKALNIKAATTGATIYWNVQGYDA
jgi:hypothetical protein